MTEGGLFMGYRHQNRPWMPHSEIQNFCESNHSNILDYYAWKYEKWSGTLWICDVIHHPQTFLGIQKMKKIMWKAKKSNCRLFSFHAHQKISHMIKKIHRFFIHVNSHQKMIHPFNRAWCWSENFNSSASAINDKH